MSWDEPCTEFSDLDLRLADMPRCDARQEEEWTYAVQASFDVTGRDPDEAIGVSPARKGLFESESPISLPNWYPLDVYKRTLCGKLQRFGFYDGRPWQTGEQDWNNMIIPDARFAPLFDQALPFKGTCGFSGDWPTCGTVTSCIEAEVTPDEGLFENPWFPKSTPDSSPLAAVQHPICAYGPWVRECVHNGKPEIHPSELLWWRDQSAAAGAGEAVESDHADYTLLQVADASDRFEEADSFFLPDGAPAGWRPWAAGPRTHAFRLAFELDPSRQRYGYVVAQRYRKGVLAGRSGTPTTGPRTLKIDGAVVVVVESPQEHPEELDIAFVDVCKRDGSVRGHVQVSTTIDGRGFHALVVSRTGSRLVLERAAPGEKVPPLLRPSPAPPPPVAQAPAVPSSPVAQHMEGTLRREIVEGKPTLVADALVEDPRATGKSRERRKISVLREEEIPVLASGMAVTHSGQVSLAAQIEAARHGPGTEMPGIWRAFSAAAEAPAPGTAPPRPVLRVSEWTLRALPSYVPVRWGRPSPEDDDPRAEELNSILAKRDDAQLKRVFGQAKDYVKADWRFEAKEIGTGRSVRVVTRGRATPEDVQVTFAGEGPASLATVKFPGHDAMSVYELRAFVTLRDTFASEASTEFTIWDALLPVAKNEVGGLVATATALAGARIESSTKDAVSDPGKARTLGRQPGSFGARETASRTLHVFASQVAADGEVTVADLRSLIAAAKIADATQR